MSSIKKQVYRWNFQWQKEQKLNVVLQQKKLLVLGREMQLQGKVRDHQLQEDEEGDAKLPISHFLKIE